jgi:DNA-directed RNA polymerase subunit RPC12/RpoP
MYGSIFSISKGNVGVLIAMLEQCSMDKMVTEMDYICGNCGHLLAENVSQGKIAIDIVFECPSCQAYNDPYNVEPRPIT